MSNSRVARMCLVAALYFTADIALNLFVLGAEGWQIFWPLNGVTTALLLMRPRQEWPLFLVTTTVSAGFGEWLTGSPAIVVAIQAFAITLEIVLQALMLPSFTDLEAWLREPGLYPRFTVAVLVGPLIAATVEAAGMAALQGYPFLRSVLDFTPNEVIGVAAMVPLILSLRSIRAQSLRDPRWWARVFIVLCATPVVMTMMFHGERIPLLFLLYPFLMWVESILGLFGSSVALTCVCVLAAVFTHEGYGPFAHALAPGTARNLSVELYLAFHLVFFLPVSIMSMERRRLTRELRAALKRATALATVDGLTGIANRRTFESRFAEQWELAARNRSSLAILMIDVDHFKAFNDALGHQAGDECLRLVARELESTVSRPTDLVARYGGEEFVMLLPDTSLDGASRIAERVRSAISNLATDHPNVAGDSASRLHCVTVSVGCAALSPQPDSRAQDLMAQADEALYSAKHAGRNRVCCAAVAHPPDARRSALERLQDRINILGAGSRFTLPKP